MNIFAFLHIYQMYKIKFPLAPLKIWVLFLEEIIHQFGMYPNLSLLQVWICVCVCVYLFLYVLYVGMVDFTSKPCYTLLLVLQIVFPSPNNIFGRPFHIGTHIVLSRFLLYAS